MRSAAAILYGWPMLMRRSFDLKFFSPPHRARRAELLLSCALAFSLAWGPLACSVGDGGTSVEQVRAMHDEGRFGATIEPLREALKQSPDDAELNFLYGQALAQTGNAHLAHWSLRKAMRDPRWKTPASLQLAYLALISRDFNEVIEITDDLIEEEPDNAQAWLMRASAHAHWKKNSALAIEASDRVLEIDSERIEAYEPKIIALLDLGRTDEARVLLEEAGELATAAGAYPSVLAWHCITTVAMDEFAGELEKAREGLDRCVADYPSNPEVVSDAIAFFDKHGETDRSLAVIEKAAEDGSRSMRVSLAHRLLYHGRSAEAEALLREATRADQPEAAAAAWLDLANLQTAIEDYAAAADSLGRAVLLAREAGVPDPSLAFQYAEMLLVAGRFDVALAEVESLAVPAQQHLIRARVAQERGDAAGALEEFDEALRLWPDNASARYYTALAAEAMGDFERAIEEYRYSIRVAPGATDARVRGATLLAAGRQWAEASEVLHSGYSSAPLDLEGELIGLRLAAMSGQDDIVLQKLGIVAARWPGGMGRALAAGAKGVSLRGGSAMAMDMLASAPGVDFSQPTYAPALGALVEYAHESGRIPKIRARLDGLYAAQPDASWLSEIRARDLELGNAEPGLVAEAYARAAELAPRSSSALAGQGRAARRAGDARAAIGYFDRAAEVDAEDPEPLIEAARVLVAAGQIEAALERIDAALIRQPWSGSAAALRVDLDLARGVVDEGTRGLAVRAVRFGGGADELDVLAAVQAQLGDAEVAERTKATAAELRANEAAAD